MTEDGASKIDGTLGVANSGLADLFLINPDGIMFGENARLDLQGSFTATTADRIEGSNSSFFSSVKTELGQLLTVQPSAFFFSNQNPISDITVRSSPRLNLSNDRGLQVSTGEQITLVGGNIELNNGALNAWEGRINLATVAGEGSVIVQTDESLFIPQGIQRGNIVLNRESILDTQLTFGGDIQLLADDIKVFSGSQILGGVERNETRPDSDQRESGDVTLDATGSIIVSSFIDPELESDSIPESSIQNVIEERAEGQSGDIIINAQTLTVSNRGEITTDTSGDGIAGNINIVVGNLSIQNGGRLSSNSVVKGSNAGNIALNIGGSAVLSGDDDGALMTGIFSTVNTTDGSARGGIIYVIANGNIEINNNAEISSRNLRTGDAGTIGVETQRSILLNNGNIINTASNGDGGQVRLDAQGAVILRGNSRILSFSSLEEDNMPSNDEEPTPVLERAGNSSARFSSVARPESSATIVSRQDERGNVVIVGNRKVELGGELNSSDPSGADGGNVVIVSNALVVVERSDIVSLSSNGTGGEIDLPERSFLGPRDSASIIQSGQDISFEGLSRILEENDLIVINSEGFVASGDISEINNTVAENDLAELPDSLVDSDVLVASSCIADGRSGDGTFTLTGNDRIPQTPTDALPTPYSIGTVQTLPPNTATADPNTIAEPSAIYELADGRLVMGRECES